MLRNMFLNIYLKTLENYKASENLKKQDSGEKELTKG